VAIRAGPVGGHVAGTEDWLMDTTLAIDDRRTPYDGGVTGRVLTRRG
jgi:hypothetical protein